MGRRHPSLIVLVWRLLTAVCARHQAEHVNVGNAYKQTNIQHRSLTTYTCARNATSNNCKYLDCFALFFFFLFPFSSEIGGLSMYSCIFSYCCLLRSHANKRAVWNGGGIIFAGSIKGTFLISGQHWRKQLAYTRQKAAVVVRPTIL